MSDRVADEVEIDVNKALGSPSRAELLDLLAAFYKVTMIQHQALISLRHPGHPELDRFDQEADRAGEALTALYSKIGSLVGADVHAH